MVYQFVAEPLQLVLFDSNFVSYHALSCQGSIGCGVFSLSLTVCASPISIIRNGVLLKISIIWVNTDCQWRKVIITIMGFPHTVGQGGQKSKCIQNFSKYLLETK